MTVNPFTATSPQIAASILSANFARLGAEIEEVLSHGADFLHLDIMDGHFVPNISFGPHVTQAAAAVTKAYLDAHLMISDPVRYAGPLVEAGARNITFHVEAVLDAAEAITEIRKLGCNVGISIKPNTPVSAITPVLNLVDVVLVMSVEPGFSGQKFMPEVLEKCRQIKPRLNSKQRLEIDGGINEHTIADAAAVGVDWFVAASAIFDASNRAAAIAALRKQLASAMRTPC